MEPYNKSHGKNPPQTGRWSKQEHERFMLGIMTYGKDWKKVQELVGTRSGSQVRSHAQKFFNKIQKQQQIKRQKQERSLLTVPETPQKNKEPESEQISGSQYDISKFNENQGQAVTPVELISLIRKQSTQKKQINLEDFQKELAEKIKNQKETRENDKKKDIAENERKFSRANSYKGMSNLISAYGSIFENEKNEPQANKIANESFLIRLAKKYRKYFDRGGNFQNLIDFGKQKQVTLDQKIETGQSKKSFTLPEGVVGDQQDLLERRKRLISESTISSQADESRDSFKVKITPLNDELSNKNRESRANNRKFS